MNKLYYPTISATLKRALKKDFGKIGAPKKEVKSNLIKWNKIFEKINIMELFQDIYNLLVTCNVTSYIIYFWVMQGINTRRIIYEGLECQI